MIKEEIIERFVKETKITLYCDAINGLSENEPCGRLAKRKCQNCGIHICNAHSNEEDNSGDYPSYFCSKCYKKYRHWTDDIEPVLEKQMEEEYERIMQNTSHNNNCTASPNLASFVDVVDYCQKTSNDGNWGVLDFYNAVKKLGNFA